MRVAFFSAHAFDRQYFDEANAGAGHHLEYFETRLTPATASLAAGYPAVCAFVNDCLSGAVLTAIAAGGTRLVALRSAGFNHVDLEKARQLHLTVARVPAYSPHAVAEHTVALMLALNRKIHKAYSRVRDANFSLDGLVGFDVHGRTVGIVGTGRIGTAVARILHGCGARLVAFDIAPSDECRGLGVEYLPLEEVWKRSDIVTLHAPLTDRTRHMVDAAAIERMKHGVMIINTGRGALIDTRRD